ncbi:fimbrial protein StdA [Salmonella enterica subsp. enterica serovar Kottbus]|nr:fimbrial protein StdA [Salmonella enterica subsp. enterica serovar Kottbus]EHN5888756.1 fimbrial protein [Salmonella enterica subsp. enterica serovar Newport]
MFRKTSLAVMAAAMICGTSAFAADTGKFGGGDIYFTGSVTDSPCSVAPGDDNLTVAFGQVSKRELKAADMVTASQPIVIHLTGCSFDPDGSGTPRPVGLMSKVNVTFNGNAAPGNKGYVNQGTAQNVVIQLLKNDNTSVILPGYLPTDADAQQLQPGNNELRFFAQLLSTGVASSGTVDASVHYTLNYL